MTRLQKLLVRLAPVLFLVAVALVVAACAPGSGTGAGGSSGPTPTPQGALHPASPGANPMDLLAWAFTPIFQLLFIILVVLDKLTGFDSATHNPGNIVVAILILTVIIKLITTPITRKQLTTSRQSQLLQPEVREIQRKYKDDRVKQNAAVQEFYKQRGVNPAGGCLPALLSMGLLIPMYSVFSGGLTNHDISPMLRPFGFDLGAAMGIVCDAVPQYDAARHVLNPCLNPNAFGINWSYPEPFTTGLAIAGFGISILAVLSSLVQLVASRQTLAPVDPRMADDQNVKVQRQMAYFLPLISIMYGGFLPAGLFLYWILSTVIQIIQQFFVLGFGGIFPFRGWYPEFARNLTPRSPVKVPQILPNVATKNPSAVDRAKALDRDLSAQATIRPNRTRTSRRGRRR